VCGALGLCTQHGAQMNLATFRGAVYTCVLGLLMSCECVAAWPWVFVEGGNAALLGRPVFV
jgi:hypothetical protein